MKVLIIICAALVSLSAIVFLAGEYQEYSDRPTDLERSMQRLDKAMKDLRESERVLRGLE